MSHSHWMFLGSAAVCLAVTAQAGLAQRVTPQSRQAGTNGQTKRTVTPKAPAPAVSHAPVATAEHNAVIKRYCVTCHNDARKTGGLSLASYDVAHAADNAELSERVVRKLQAGLMPPPAAARP